MHDLCITHHEAAERHLRRPTMKSVSVGVAVLAVLALMATTGTAAAAQGGGAAQGGSMSFFITSVGSGDGANLGGLAGADRDGRRRRRLYQPDHHDLGSRRARAGAEPPEHGGIRLMSGPGRCIAPQRPLSRTTYSGASTV